MNVVLSGLGRVGRAFVEHIHSHGDDLAREYGVHVRVKTVRAGTEQCLLDGDGPVPPRSDWRPLTPLRSALNGAEADIFVQAIPSTPALREFAAEEALTALRNGVHVVTATKSHLLTHWSRLGQAAAESGTRIRISGATGAALPAGDLARSAMRGLGCNGIRACPNGTATFVLDRLAAGDSIDDAVREAQRRGIAEADPSADLSGADSATKLKLMAALLWAWNPECVRVESDEIDAGTSERAVAVAARGGRLRAVAQAHLAAPHLVRVVLEETAPGDPLYALAGPEKAVTFQSPDGGDVTVSGGRSHPLGAALSLVRDIIDIASPHRGFR
ncbi:hypothetical protein [Sinosporangium siamense]|uniref:hypothetical protein n=1 Tax=Sinosporangium siamense TaxID=1367973 RepID=UPI00194F9DA8|nr:hypothetical protein [Sinosporangium siamense]